MELKLSIKWMGAQIQFWALQGLTCPKPNFEYYFSYFWIKRNKTPYFYFQFLDAPRKSTTNLRKITCGITFGIQKPYKEILHRLSGGD